MNCKYNYAAGGKTKSAECVKYSLELYQMSKRELDCIK